VIGAEGLDQHAEDVGAELWRGDRGDAEGRPELGVDGRAAQIDPAHLIGGGLVLAAAGFALTAWVDASSGLVPIVVRSVIYSLEICPAVVLATDLVVSSAPAERAGSAAAISETSAELGGALGIAILGSIGTAVYRRGMVDGIPRVSAERSSSPPGRPSPSGCG